MVWTGDGRVFFFNPSHRISLWEKPEELQGRADVDKMLQSPPDGNKDKEKDGEEEDEPATKKAK